MIAILLVTLATLAFICWYYVQKQKYKSLDYIPGPPPWPVIGNVLDAGTNTVDQIKRLFELQKKYGNVYRLWIGPSKVMLVISDPEMMEFFLGHPKRNYKDFLYNLFVCWLGNGLIISNGIYWQKHRKLVTPAFHFKILEQFLPVFHSNGNILINNLSKKNEENKNGFDIYDLISLYALDVICETSMGASIHAQDHPEHKYVQAVEVLRTKIIERVFSVWKQSDYLFKFASCYKDVQNALNTVHSFVRDIIEKRRDMLLKETNTENTENLEDEDGVKKRFVLLDVLLKSTIDGQPLQNDEIKDEVHTFMFAGHDTTTSAAFFALYSIAKYPEIQRKIIEELIPIFDGDKNKEFTAKDLQEMKYIECVIKETLRLYPSGPFFSRTIENDIEYKGHILPKGTVLIMFVFGMHRDPKFYENPEEFNPDRFLSQNTTRENYFSYLPFSAGPRNCIGQKFAMMELKSVISKIVYNFEIILAEPDKPMILSAESVLGTADKHLFKLKKRIL